VQEARQNLAGPRLAIRIDESEWRGQRHFFNGVPVTVVIDASGHVRSAQAVGSSKFIPQALAIAKTLEYRPFLRNGAAIEVEVDEYVRVLPLEKVPTKQVPFPKVDDFSSVRFSLERTECFGSCPAYNLQIAGDGLVTYHGNSNVDVVGEQTAHLTTEAIRRLLEAFEKADFFSLEDRYETGVTDFPTYTIGIKIGGITKTVVDYAGDEMGMPEAVTRLENEMDAVAGTVKWIGRPPR